MTDAVDHPLAGVLRAAASGAFPQVDGLAELVRRTPPGNAASLRELIARGFRPIGSEVLIEVSAAGT